MDLLSSRTKLGRYPARGGHDFETIAAILDEGFFCHVGFVVNGQPYVIPTGFGRDGHTLYIHGSAASRMLNEAGKGVALSVTVTLVDGLVLARSAFHSSVNYRSVVILGTAEPVPAADKLRALKTISDHIIPGRWESLRPTRPPCSEWKSSRRPRRCAPGRRWTTRRITVCRSGRAPSISRRFLPRRSPIRALHRGSRSRSTRSAIGGLKSNDEVNE